MSHRYGSDKIAMSGTTDHTKNKIHILALMTNKSIVQDENILINEYVFSSITFTKNISHSFQIILFPPIFCKYF